MREKGVFERKEGDWKRREERGEERKVRDGKGRKIKKMEEWAR